MYKIDKGIPIPKPRWRKYPFGEMDVGDSFFIPNSDVEGLKHKRQAVCVTASQYGRRNGKKFSTHTVDGGYRCWRIE